MIFYMFIKAKGGHKMKQLLIIILLCQTILASPCSIFKYKTGEYVYFCGNEDWTAKDPALIAIKQQKNDYGLVLLGWKSYLPDYPQAGINSEGLCFDWAAVPAQKYEFVKGKADLTINSTIEILKKCKNITEVLAYLNKYNFSHLAEEHIIFTDRYGDSCVIEYTKGKQRIVQTKSHAQFITNFNLTDKEAGWYPCARYSKLEVTLKKENLSENNLIEALASVHQEGDYPTIYSYVFDLHELKLKVFYNHIYNKYQEYKLQELIKTDKVISIE